MVPLSQIRIETRTFANWVKSSRVKDVKQIVRSVINPGGIVAACPTLPFLLLTRKVLEGLAHHSHKRLGIHPQLVLNPLSTMLILPNNSVYTPTGSSHDYSGAMKMFIKEIFGKTASPWPERDDILQKLEPGLEASSIHSLLKHPFLLTPEERALEICNFVITYDRVKMKLGDFKGFWPEVYGYWEENKYLEYLKSMAAEANRNREAWEVYKLTIGISNELTVGIPNIDRIKPYDQILAKSIVNPPRPLKIRMSRNIVEHVSQRVKGTSTPPYIVRRKYALVEDLNAGVSLMFFDFRWAIEVDKEESEEILRHL